MKLVSRTLSMLVVLIMVLGMVAASAMAEAKDMTVYYIGKDANSSFWQTVNAGAQKAAEDYGVKLESLNPQSESEIEAQVTMVETAINAGAAAIALAPLDTNALITACQEVKAAGIPLTLIDSVIKSEDYDVAYKTDNKAAGAASAKALATKVGGKGKLYVLSAVAGSESCNLRDQGFIEEIKANWPDMEVINADSIQNCNNDVNQAMSITTDVLAANPDLVGMFGDNNYACKGLATAVKEAGSTVTVAGFDSDTDLVAMLAEGTIFSLALQQPYMMGYKAVEGAYKLASGEKLEHGIMDTGFTIATKENMEEPDVKALLG